MVGTAEYQVTPWSRTMRQNESGLNCAGTTTVPPVEKVASVDATRPCTWNSGITHSETSLGRQARRCARCSAPRPPGCDGAAARASAGRCCRWCAAPARCRPAPGRSRVAPTGASSRTMPIASVSRDQQRDAAVRAARSGPPRLRPAARSARAHSCPPDRSRTPPRDKPDSAARRCRRSTPPES